MAGGGRGLTVVAVKEVANAVPKEEWTEDRLLPGDIIDKVASLDGQLEVSSPFAGGKAGLETELRQMFRASSELLSVWVKRGTYSHTPLELKACVIPEEPVIPKKHYTIRYYNDFRHVVQLVDAHEDDCMRWQESTRKVLQSRWKGALQQHNNLLPYPWAQKIQTFLPVNGSPMVFSILFMPFQPSLDCLGCKDLEDTIARAMAWFSSAQVAGVPLIFVSIQTELVFKESSKDSNAFFDPNGKDAIQQCTSYGRFNISCVENSIIDVARGVRLWYVPAATEVEINLMLAPGEGKFGLSLASNEEGFCYVASVEDSSAGDRAGVKELLEVAKKVRKLLVVSRVEDEKVVPWLVSCYGSIHCFGATTIREQLSTLRESNKCAHIHLMVWDIVEDGISTKVSKSMVQETDNFFETKRVVQETKNFFETNLDIESGQLSMFAPTISQPQSIPFVKKRSVTWSDDLGGKLAINN